MTDRADVVEDSADPILKGVLDDLVRRADRYSGNLNGKVIQEQVIPPIYGGFGDVSQGYFGPTRVAIKTLRLSRATDLRKLKNAFREVHVWSKLQHDHVLPMLGITTDFHNTLSIVSRWMPNGNAKSYVQNRSIDPRPLLGDIARGLHYLHTLDRPVFHGDLKGENVLVDLDGRALLADFGISFLVNSSFSVTSSQPHGGSLHWMAPELLMDDKKISASADVWAFGMTALELFTRRPPWHPVSNLGAVITQIMQRAPLRPEDAVTCFRMTDVWWNLCQACWKRAPELRHDMTKIVSMMASNDGKFGIMRNPPAESSTHQSGSHRPAISIPQQAHRIGPQLTLTLSIQCASDEVEHKMLAWEVVSVDNATDSFRITFPTCLGFGTAETRAEGTNGTQIAYLPSSFQASYAGTRLIMKYDGDFVWRRVTAAFPGRAVSFVNDTGIPRGIVLGSHHEGKNGVNASMQPFALIPTMRPKQEFEITGALALHAYWTTGIRAGQLLTEDVQRACVLNGGDGIDLTTAPGRGVIGHILRETRDSSHATITVEPL